MKPTFLFPIGLACCLACTSPNQTETTAVRDTTVLAIDTAVVEANPAPATAPTTTSESAVAGDGELMEEKGKIVYLSRNQYSFVSDPYDFALDPGSIESLLGEGATTKTEEHEGGEDYGPYSYSTVTFEDTEISFYSYPGKHFSYITTPRLPLKNGIIIGMKKPDFLTAMTFDNENAPKADVYRLVDDFGHMDFSFQADTLYLIYAYYEEGD